MRMSQPTIDALLALIKDPNTLIRGGIMKALRHRGLVDENDQVNELGRKAARELAEKNTVTRQPQETRIHLENEPATLAQLRVLKALMGYEPQALSKEDASTLISFLKDLKATTEQAEYQTRLKTLKLLVDAGAQAIDAIGYSDQAPVRLKDGSLARPALLSVGTKKNKPVIAPAVILADGTPKPGRELSLRPRGDVRLSRSQARTTFERIATAK
jgi:predicted nuclease with TOPRIM domain